MSEIEGLRRRIALLEDASTKAWAERDELESRISALEQEHAAASRASHQGIEANAKRLTELAVFAADLPHGHALDAALQQLQGLEKHSSGQGMWLQNLFSRLDTRISAMETCIQDVVQALQTPQYARNTILAETLSAQFSSLRETLDSKADDKDQHRLADALSQSCRDLTSTLRVYRHDLTSVEQKCDYMSQSIQQNEQALGELGEFLATRDEELSDLERRWSKRLWGYREISPSSARHARPQSAGGTNQPDAVHIKPWRPWSPNGFPQVATKPPKKPSQGENLAPRSRGSGPERTAAELTS
jgi:chromosome segregation ATPase